MKPVTGIDPLTQRLTAVNARIIAADNAVRSAIEAWVLTRAAFGQPAPRKLVNAITASGLLAYDVAHYVYGDEEEAADVEPKQ